MSASTVKINRYPFSLLVSVVSSLSFGTLAILSPEFGNSVCAGVCDVSEDVAEVELEVLLSVAS